MISRIMTNRMKAAAIAAVMCISATSFALPSIVETASLTVSAAAVKVGTVLESSNDTDVEDDYTYHGYIADLAKSGVNSITLTLKPNYTGNFAWGMGIGIADSPYWMEYDSKDGWIDSSKVKKVNSSEVAVTKDKEFTITVDTSDLELSYNPSTTEYPGKFDFRAYYTGEDAGTVTIVSAEANAKVTPTEESTEATTEKETKDTEKDTEDTKTTETDSEEATDDTKTTEKTEPTEEVTEVTPSDAIAVLTDDTKSEDRTNVFVGKVIDYAESGIKTITFVLDTGDYSGEIAYGFGISIKDKPYWMELDGAKFVDTKDGTVDAAGGKAAASNGECVIVIDVSKIDVKYTDPYSDGSFELRNYYSDGNEITLKAIEINSDKEPTTLDPTEETEDEHSLAEKSGQTQNPKNGSWSFKDNEDGTGTMTAVLGRQVEFETPLTLTQGYDEEYYAKEDKSPTEGVDPLNSHKFNYSDFGLVGVGAKGNVVVESIMATIQSKQPVKNFMYGGGLNVENQSPADTESAKAAKGVATTKDAGYWYNDMGQDKIAEFEEAGVEFGLTPRYGYFLTSEENQLGEYFNVFWDVPEAVKPYETAGAISFQYWYGVEDAEEYTEIPEVELTGGVITYTETQTFKYTDHKSTKLNKKVTEGEMSGEIEFKKDLGLEEGQEVKAVVFTVSADTDLDKLVYGVGASVGEDWQQWAGENDKWNYVVTNTASGDIEIAWMPPASVNLNEEGNIQFGYWYGGKDGKELSSITLKSVDVYYKQKALAELWGDANCDGTVDILDVVLLNRTILGKDTVTEQGLANADLNMNEVPDIIDSQNILKLIVKLLTQEDCPLK